MPRLTRDLDRGPAHPIMHPVDAIPWKKNPPTLPPGVEVALLEGILEEPGFLAMRLKMPDGYVLPPHWHPHVERVTVISGTLRLGRGEEVDREKTHELPAGSYSSMPPETPHFGIAVGDTIVQLNAVGPWEINYVNSGDDPRNG